MQILVYAIAILTISVLLIINKCISLHYDNIMLKLRVGNNEEVINDLYFKLKENK